METSQTHSNLPIFRGSVQGSWRETPPRTEVISQGIMGTKLKEEKFRLDKEEILYCEGVDTGTSYPVRL